MKFFYENLIDATVAYSGTPEVDNPTSNLNDPRKFNTFLDNSPASGANVKIDFGADKECDSVVMGNFFTTGATTCTISGSNDDSSYTVVDSFASYTTIGNKIAEFTQATWRYWKITFTTAGSFTKLQIGNILLGNQFELSHNPELSVGENSGYRGLINQTETGYKSSIKTQSTNRENFSFDYQYANPTDKTGFEDLRDGILMTDNESVYPFFFEFNSSYYFARWNGLLNLTQQAFQAYQTNINLIGEL